MSNSSFWFMGGYARFVWPCFAFVLAVLGWNLWSARQHLWAAKRRAHRALAVAGAPKTASAT